MLGLFFYEKYGIILLDRMVFMIVKNPGNSFTLLSSIYIILLTIVYFSKPRAKNLETKIYSYIVITCLIGCIVSLGTYYFIYCNEPG